MSSESEGSLVESYDGRGSEDVEGQVYQMDAKVSEVKIEEDGSYSLQNTAVMSAYSNYSNYTDQIDAPPPGDFSEDNSEDYEEEKTQTFKNEKEEQNPYTWNEKYQKFLSLQNKEEKFRNLSQLARDFSYAARVYGKIIISEVHLPENEKTIKSMSVGGVAGGIKYICQGILFKFAVDVKPVKEKPVYLYSGGSAPDDSKAQKVALHEIKGLMSFAACQLPEIHFPLMTLIHYRGFCLTAMTLLPLKQIVYGSNDAGLTCHNDVESIGKLMKLAGSLLGLRSHKVKDKIIYGPADLEIHEGKDNNYYMLDFARAMPAESPHYTGNVTGIWYHLLRPAFVMNYKSTLGLCSDSFTSWCAGDENAKEMALDVKLATDHLYQVIIPNLAENLLKRFKKNTQLNLPNELHKAGVNLRHLGHVRSNVLEKGKNTPEATKLQKVILSECVARVLKNEVRIVLRKEMEKIKQPVEEPYFHRVFSWLSPYLLLKKVPSTIVLDSYEEFISHNDGLLKASPELPSIVPLVANYPILKSQKSFYMELTLISGSCGVGLLPVDKETKLKVEVDSEGVSKHVVERDDGKKLKDMQFNINESEVVGLFYNRDAKLFCWTKNGKPLGATLENVPDNEYLPTIGITPGTEVRYNFGKTPFAFNILSFCSTLGVEPPDLIVDLSYKSEKKWKWSLKKKLVSTYRQSLTEIEGEEKIFDLQTNIDMFYMVNRFQELSGITLSSRVPKAIEQQNLVLLPQDIIQLKSRVRNVSIIDFATGVSQFLQTQSKVMDTKKTQTILKNSKKLVENAISASPIVPPEYYLYMGHIYLALGNSFLSSIESSDSPNLIKSTRNWTKARYYYQRVIRETKRQQDKLKRYFKEHPELQAPNAFAHSVEALLGIANIAFEESVVKIHKWNDIQKKQDESFELLKKEYLNLLSTSEDKQLLLTEIDNLKVKTDTANHPLAMTKIYMKVEVLTSIMNDQSTTKLFVLIKTLSQIHKKSKQISEWDRDAHYYLEKAKAEWNRLIKTESLLLDFLKTFCSAPIHGNELAVLLHLSSTNPSSQSILEKTFQSMTQINISTTTQLMKNHINAYSKLMKQSKSDLKNKLLKAEQLPIEEDIDDVGFYVEFRVNKPTIIQDLTDDVKGHDKDECDELELDLEDFPEIPQKSKVAEKRLEIDLGEHKGKGAQKSSKKNFFSKLKPSLSLPLKKAKSYSPAKSITNKPAPNSGASAEKTLQKAISSDFNAEPKRNASPRSPKPFSIIPQSMTLPSPSPGSAAPIPPPPSFVARLSAQQADMPPIHMGPPPPPAAPVSPPSAAPVSPPSAAPASPPSAAPASSRKEAERAPSNKNLVPPASSPAGPAPTRNLMTQSASSSSHHDMKLHKSPRREAKSRKNFWNTEKEKKDKDKDEKAKKEDHKEKEKEERTTKKDENKEDKLIPKNEKKEDKLIPKNEKKEDKLIPKDEKLKKEDHKEKDKEEWTTKKDEKKEDMLIIVKAEKKAGRSGDRKNKSMRSRGKAEKDSASSRMMADEPPIDQIKECQGEYESLSKTVLSRKRSDLVPETGTSEKSQYEENCLCFEDSVSEAKGRQRRSSSPRLTPPPLGYLLDCVCLNKTLTNPNISEINKWKQVNHAHLHAIQAVWEDSQHLYAIREPLEEAAFSFTLSESQIITILSSVLEGLEALHSNSVLHLQLELSSILCDDNNNYVLSKDFHCSDLPAIYLPPKERENSVLADLWSVAVVAFYLLFKTFENVSSRDGSSFIKELPKRQDAPKVANLINMIITNHASTATVCLNLLK